MIAPPAAVAAHPAFAADQLAAIRAAAQELERRGGVAEPREADPDARGAKQDPNRSTRGDGGQYGAGGTPEHSGKGRPLPRVRALGRSAHYGRNDISFRAVQGCPRCVDSRAQPMSAPTPSR